MYDLLSESNPNNAGLIWYVLYSTSMLSMITGFMTVKRMDTSIRNSECMTKLHPKNASNAGQRKTIANNLFVNTMDIEIIH